MVAKDVPTEAAWETMNVTITERGIPVFFDVGGHLLAHRDTAISDGNGRHLVISNMTEMPRVWVGLRELGPIVLQDMRRPCHLRIDLSSIALPERHDAAVRHCVEHFDEVWETGELWLKTSGSCTTHSSR
jgi:hypothetical protein